VAIDPDSLSILLHPSKILRERARNVPDVDEQVRAVASRMIELMQEHEGIGLAAPQVGVAWRLFVTRHADDRDRPGGLVYINPTIEVLDGTRAEDQEGCLSLPGVDVLIRRPISVRLRATSLDGEEVVEECDEHFARVWQHEVDHLDGVLIIDRMNTMERLRNRKAIRDLERA
jgi:peptide deformylase